MKLRDIYNFFQGHTSKILDDLDVQPEHLKEQILQRASKCPKSCQTKKRCAHCGCAYPAKLYNTKSCNNLPDLMSEEQQTKYKIDNAID